jgi:glycerol kinase
MAPPQPGLVLALDQGGHASRAIVFDAEGRTVATALHEVGESRPSDARVEQDPEELVRSLRRAIKDVVKRLGPRERELGCAGLATQRSSIVCWDTASGAALSPVISWQDRRAQDRIDALSEHAAEVRERTGLRLSPHYGASKLAWCLANVPAVASALREGQLAFGPLASFLAFRLADERPLVADPANASRTLLWNVSTRAWDPRLCDLFGVPIAALPRCVPTRHAFGSLDVGKRKIPLSIVTGDQSAALFASGEPRADTAYVNFGTGAFVQRAFDDATLDSPRLLKSVVFADEARTKFALEGTVNGAGSALQWAIQALELQKVEPTLDDWLARETDPPLFLNGVSGLGAPFWVPRFESRFVTNVSLGSNGSSETKLVAVLESTVFLVQIILDEMTTALPSPARIQVSGGLSHLNGLVQRLASLSRVAVDRSREPEATARGLAQLLMTGASFRTAEFDRFEPRDDAKLRDRFDRFRAEIGRGVTEEVSKGSDS